MIQYNEDEKRIVLRYVCSALVLSGRREFFWRKFIGFVDVVNRCMIYLFMFVHVCTRVHRTDENTRHNMHNVPTNDCDLGIYGIYRRAVFVCAREFIMTFVIVCIFPDLPLNMHIPTHIHVNCI